MGVWLLLWVTRGAHNPNLQVAIALAPHVCSYSLIWSSTENEWNASHAIWSHAFRPSITCDLITHVLTICHVKLTQSTVFEQKCFDLPSLSPALRNLWLLLVYRGRQCAKFDIFGTMGTIVIESPRGAFQWYNIMLYSITKCLISFSLSLLSSSSSSLLL